TLLQRTAAATIDRRAIEEAGHVLEQALAAHGVETRLVGMTVGPTVTRYELELGTGVKVNKVTSLNKDIAYAMASPDVRILAPIPARSAIGVEVPNRQRQLVALGDILTSDEARRAVHPLEVGLGRDITGYNAAYDRGDLKPQPGEDKTYDRLPFILVVVDELNDLMMVAARDVEESICRIAQMGRAFGIHLVIATQRPSVDVITGVIKANIPSRLAFMVSSLADSRVILDQPGAERLIGKGDMLLLGASSNVPRRIQGSWVSEEEVHKLVAHWRRQASPQYVEGVEGEDSPTPGGPGFDEEDDDMLEPAMDLVVRSQLGSTSMLQRKLRVGFARAGRIMDLLERRGVVGPSEGSKARAVLMTVEELDTLRERTG